MTPRDDLLEADLRELLRERALDVHDVPESVFAFERRPSVDTSWIGRLSHPHRPALLAAAAAIVAVLSVVGGVLAVVGDGDRPAPAVHTGGTATAPTTTPPTTNPQTTNPQTTPGPSAHVTRSARLSWFGITAPRGYGLGARDSKPGYQTLGLSKAGDTLAIPGSNGGSPYQSYVTVYEPGVLKANPVLHPSETTTVGGARAYFGTHPLTDGGPAPKATLAWKSPAGRWVLVQGRTAMSSTHAALLTVARAVRPDTFTPATVPFRLGYAPPGARVTDMSVDLGVRRYPFQIELDSPSGVIDLLVAPSVASANLDPNSPVAVRTVDGHATEVQVTAPTTYPTSATRLGPTTVVSVQVNPVDGSDVITATQTTLFERLLSGLTFPGGSVIAAVPAEAALP